MKMKKSVSLILSALVVSQSTIAFGQNIGTINPIVGAGSGSSFIGAPGAYDINQITQNNTDIMRDVLARTASIQDQDKQYLQSIADRVNSKLGEINSLRMKMISMQRQQSEILLDDYITVINSINEKTQALSLDLVTSSAITRESLPSFSPVQVGNVSATVNNFGNINLSEFTNKIRTLLDSWLSEMNNLKFENKIKTKNNQQVNITANALNPDLRGIRILTAQEIKDYQRKIAIKMTLDDETTMVYQQGLVDKTVNLINIIVNNYGSSEWLRFTDDNDGKALKSAYREVSDAFFRRSYLRKKYGIRMGALQSKGYPKRIVNFEKFALQPIKEAVGSFMREAAMSDEELLAAFESARNFVQLYDEKVTPVLKSKDVILSDEGKKLEFSSSDTGFLVRANSAITYLTGQRPTAEVLLSIMRLVLSDITEERLLMANRIEELKSYHDSKYRSTAELKKQNNIRICEIDFTLSQAVHDANCKPIGVVQKAVQRVGGNGTDMASIFGNLVMSYETTEKANRQEANWMRKLVEAALKAGNDQNEQDESDTGLFN